MPSSTCRGGARIRIYRRDDLDDEAEQPPEPQDVKLRRLVDELPPDQRHMVERVFFGGDTVNQAARELDITRARAERVMSAGQQQLREWLESGWEPQVETEAGRLDSPTLDPAPVTPERCEQETEWGRCVQPAVGAGLCVSHLMWSERGITPNRQYHRKIVHGHRPVESFLNEQELETIINGRYRGDGRRIDQYIAGGALGYKPRGDS